MEKSKNTVLRISLSPRNCSNSLISRDLTQIQGGDRDKNGTGHDSSFFSDNLLYAALTELSEKKKMHFFAPIPNKDFRSCQLSEGKEWFVYFYVRSPRTEKLQRVRIKVNRIHNARERRKWARKMMQAIDQRLMMGWNPLLEEIAPKAGVGLYAAMEDYLTAKEKEMEPNSMRSYRSFIKNFKIWLEKHRFTDTSMVSSFTSEMADIFLSEIEQDVTPKTYNNYVAFFKALFAWFVCKGYASDNPFESFKKKPKRLIKKKRRLLTDEELRHLFTYCAGTREEHLALCLMTYCCFIRPKELALLKCKDVDLENQRVHIRAEIAKNDNDSYRTIPSMAIKAFQHLDLSHPDWFLFGQNPGTDNFSPSLKPVCSRKIATWWNAYVRPACGFGKDVQFYSLKDTGITNMLAEGVPINLVQQQADHYSVAMTAIYVGKKSDMPDELKNADILPEY